MKKLGVAEPITSVLDPKQDEAQQTCSACGKPKGKISKEAFKQGDPTPCSACGRS